MRFNPKLVAVLIISETAAVIAPLNDAVFFSVTFGSSILQAFVLGLLVFAGYFFAQQTGLQLAGHGPHSPILIGMSAAALVAVYVVALDCYLFRLLLPQDYVNFLRSPLIDRLAYFMLRAFNENVVYRLFLFSGLVYLISIARGLQGLTTAWVVTAMIIAQGINVYFNIAAIAPGPFSAEMLAYDGLRYLVPGVVWAWIYWRVDFFAAEIASVGCHVFLQPVIGMLI
jgi:hypothetical protein